LDHLKIETRGDHVILRGIVASLSERVEVKRAVWTTPGVCHVDNNLTVERLTKARKALMERQAGTDAALRLELSSRSFTTSS
jgi:hypothetical protein